MSRLLKLRSLVSSRTLSSTRSIQVDQKGSGFGSSERAKTGQEPVKDTAPYQNEYTKSGTNTEVAHEKESYSRNTDPSESNRRQGAALDHSPANANASRDATSGEPHRSGRDRTTPSGYAQGAKSSSSSASAADKSEAKFGKISKEHDDIQTVGGRKVTQ